MSYSKIPIFCVLFLLEISFINAQNVGIGTAVPAQKLEVAGIVRLVPKSHNGTTLNRLITIDADGDINANPETGFPALDAVSYDLSGQVIKPNMSCQVNLPGPIMEHTVIGSFKFFTSCNGTVEPLIVNFKRYGGYSTGHAFTYSIGNGATTTIVNTNTVNIPWNTGCSNETLTITLDLVTNNLTFSVVGGLGLYLHSGRTTLLRWL
mgnify:CR=1 FL=1